MPEATHVSPVTVEWGDCDEAGIVFYPNYFYWFDCAFQQLLRTKELNQKKLRLRFHAVTPLVECNARFRRPASYDDNLSVTATIDSWELKRFRIYYSVTRDGEVVAEGYEVRAWAALQPDGTLRGGPVAPEFKQLFESDGV
jgi:YbgC/YbaW family acyl-CoA thioester hydrolase